jgi:isoleucyl-tRNA synthetase
MYTFAPSSLARRSAQTVLWQITEALVRLVAPILTFTADEIWEHLPPVADREISVHLARFPKPEEIFSENPAKLIEEWKKMFEIRDAALRVLEQERQAKRIGKGLEADVLIEASGEALSLLQRYSSPDLKEVLNVSAVRVEEYEIKSSNLQTSESEVILPSLGRHIEIRAVPASGQKCARCWNFMPDTADYGIWHDVCGRCRSALKEMGIAPPKPEAT